MALIQLGTNSIARRFGRMVALPFIGVKPSRKGNAAFTMARAEVGILAHRNAAPRHPAIAVTAIGVPLANHLATVESVALRLP